MCSIEAYDKLYPMHAESIITEGGVTLTDK